VGGGGQVLVGERSVVLKQIEQAAVGGVEIHDAMISSASLQRNIALQ
jgi:hypothetical protein